MSAPLLKLDLSHGHTGLYVLSAALALLSHLAVQLREPRAPPFVHLFLFAAAAAVYALHTQYALPLGTAAAVVARMAGVWVATIFASMAIYRTFFHRLRRFPGPRRFALSKFVSIPMDLAGQRPYRVTRWHEQYGSVIRIGPRELSVADPAALPAIYGATGASARCTRGPWYAFTVESTRTSSYNLQSTPTMTDHAARRKVWDAAFSLKALKGYEENVISNVELVIEQVGAYGAKGPVDVGQWMSWFGFDVMGEVGFGRGFDMVKSATTAKPIVLLEQGVKLIMASGNVAWLMAMFKYLPNPIVLFEAWIRETLEQRVREGKTGVVEHDVFSWLLGEAKNQGATQTMPELNADAGLLIVAGSDTSSNTMAITIYELLRNSGAYARLQAEVDEEFGIENATDFTRLGKLPYLNAVINETLRLWPPVASGLQRNTPPEGLLLPDGTHIPGNTVVSTATYTMHRDARNFTDPHAFKPDRWLSKPAAGEVFNQRAFSAFGYGPTGCIGKNLAFMEMRAMIARFAQSFDAQLAPGFSPERFEASIKDCFVLVKDPINITVTPRRNAPKPQ